MKGTLKRTAAFTDIHFGKSNNSEVHNQDCLAFVEWFVEQVKSDPTIDSIAFLGDWFDNRATINVMTLNYSFRAANLLNSLGIPIYFIIGNHDLYHRNTREVYSVINFHSLENFRVINEVQVIDDFIKPALFCPYLFHDEYPDLTQYANLNTWWGHFEFRGFVITGYSITMQHGPDAEEFADPVRIFSGHYHKRQSKGNMHYIGNTFPQSFADAGDNNRGMMVYDHSTDDITFIDWVDCPKYQSVKMSSVIDNSITLHQNAKVKCLLDVPLTYEDSIAIKSELIEMYNLRDFILEENPDLLDALTGDDTKLDELTNESSVEFEDQEAFNESVVTMLMSVQAQKINPDMLAQIYVELS